MAAIVCPTVLADSIEDYKVQLDNVARFAKRIHLDMADGVFAPSKTIDIKDMWRPDGIEINLHVMYQEPHKYVEDMLALRPRLIIVHSECSSDILALAKIVHEAGVQFGVALLADTPVEKIKGYLSELDHVLLFAGTLGSHGGIANLGILDKAKELHDLKPELEIGWDGGVSDKNAADLVKGGVTVLNTGGFIQHAEDPSAAFEKLQAEVDAAHLAADLSS
jgi:ribulose-phosphate 3-epimerase